MIYLFSDIDSYIPGRYIHYFYTHENNTFYYHDNTNYKYCGVYYYKDDGWEKCGLFNYTLPDTLNIICTDFDDDIASICEHYKDKLIFNNI